MRTEMSQAKRENRHYLASVDKGKAIEAIIKRKRKQGASEEEVREQRGRSNSWKQTSVQLEGMLVPRM